MQALNQVINLVMVTAYLDFNALGVVTYPARQFEFVGQPPYEWAETNALNDPAEPDSLTDNVRVFRSLHEVISPYSLYWREKVVLPDSLGEVGRS